MKTKSTIVLISVMILIAPLLGYGQDVKALNKAFQKAINSVSKSGIDIPGFGKNLNQPNLSGDAHKLYADVENTVSEVLKTSKDMPIFSLEDLNADQISQLTSTDKPFSTLMDIKGETSRDELEGMVRDQLEKTGAFDVIENSEEIIGFENPLGGKDVYVSDVVNNTISALDESGAKMIGKFVK